MKQCGVTIEDLIDAAIARAEKLAASAREIRPRWLAYLAAAQQAGVAWEKYENGTEDGSLSDTELEAEMIATQSALEDAEKAMNEAVRALALLDEEPAK